VSECLSEFRKIQKNSENALKFRIDSSYFLIVLVFRISFQKMQIIQKNAEKLKKKWVEKLRKYRKFFAIQKKIQA
jgi:hypothetical protein